ncbi:MAG: type II toxin-antitoxin system VapC family toxin [Lysobacterales bacterium]
MLLDTCIVIDVLRGRQAALSFVDGLADAPSLSVITATELVAGLRNTQERRVIERLLEVYTIHDIDLEIASLAGDYVRQYGPSQGVDPIDALIAATVNARGLELVTLNLKHFPMIKELKRPYRP